MVEKWSVLELVCVPYILYVQPDWSGKVSTKYILGNLIDNGYFLSFSFFFWAGGWVLFCTVVKNFCSEDHFYRKKFLNYFLKILGLLNPSVADGARHVLGLASAVAFFFFFFPCAGSVRSSTDPDRTLSDLAEQKNRWPNPGGARPLLAGAPPPVGPALSPSSTRLFSICRKRFGGA